MAVRSARSDVPSSVPPAPENAQSVAVASPGPSSVSTTADERTFEPMSLSADATPEGRRERHRRETFERLVKAAREIMFNRGFNDITVQDITDAADVGKGTFFNYFRSKEHVVSRVHEYNRRSVDRAVEQVRTTRAAFPDAFASILTAALCPSGGEWLTYQTNTMRAIAVNAEVRGLVSQEMMKTRQAHETLIALAQGQGAVRTDMSAAELAFVQQTFLAGLTVALWIHHTAPTPELVADITRQFCAVLQPPPSTAATAGAARTAPKTKATRVARRSKARTKPRPASRGAVRNARRER